VGVNKKLIVMEITGVTLEAEYLAEATATEEHKEEEDSTKYKDMWLRELFSQHAIVVGRRDICRDSVQR